MKRILLALLIVSLAGCGVSTVRELKSDPAGWYVTDTLTPLGDAYSRILARMGECWSMGLGMGPAVIGSQNQKRNTARITMKAHQMSGSEVFMVVELSGTTEGTRGEVYYASSGMASKASMVKAWAEGALDCEQ